ncbi:hypothetical protein FRC03_010122 [Tulasnella sp. 419]|nr:hypothetical protein FRC03_010122 [Tulasnella sp. 419]
MAGFRAFVADDEPEVTMQTLSSICEALSAPRAIDGEDTLAWPCPKLTLLYCDSWPDWNPLLRARYGPEASSQCPAPAPLGRITFAGYPDPLPYENLQLVGEMCTLTNAAFAFQT